MIPFIIGGIFLAGLMIARDKVHGSSERWKSYEEHQHFKKARDQWHHDGWMLYR